MSGRDAEDLDRLRWALSRAAAGKIEELRKIGLPPGTRDWRILRDLARADPAALTDEDLAEVERLAWRYRRRLPRYLAPRMNPDDPVVQAMEDADG